MGILDVDEFGVICEWEKEGIPEKVVIESINQLVRQKVIVRSVIELQMTVTQNFIKWIREGKKRA